MGIQASKPHRRVGWTLALVLPLGIFWIGQFTNPFSVIYDEKDIPLTGLSVQQEANIARAASLINHTVIAPGQSFSFNQRVGPRTRQKGFLPAPAYLNEIRSESIGGGICVLSSLLYQLALAANLPILERHAHSQVMETISPGLDATVWYGQADLIFQNTHQAPLLLSSRVHHHHLRVALIGRLPQPKKQLRRVTQRLPNRLLKVWVYRLAKNGQRQLISTDRYITQAGKDWNLSRSRGWRLQ